MENENTRTRAAGVVALRQREHVELRYYDELAGNRTYGVGTLAGHGPCTAAELQRPVTLAQVDATLATRLQV